MKPRYILLALLFCLLFPLPVRALEAESLSAEAAVLVDAETGQVLYDKNMDQRMYPASITKILTGMLALETLTPDEILTASEEAVDLPSWGSNIGLEAGEELTVEQAMYALMLRSANEVANVLAESIAGTQSAFAELMNKRAAELGATGTHFTNAHGLSGRDHYTTARDMAEITRHAVQTPGFLEYFGAATYRMDETNLSDVRYFTNTHSMLPADSWQHNPDAVGGKTGYTTPAGNTLVTLAQRDGRWLIAVVLKAESPYADTEALLDHGFTGFFPATYTIPVGEAVRIPVVEDGQETGSAVLTYPSWEVSLLLPEGVDAAEIELVLQCPDTLEAGQEPEGGVLLTLDSGVEGFPGILYTLPYQKELTMWEQPEAEPAEPVQPTQPQSAIAQRFYFKNPFVPVSMGLAITSLCLLLVLSLFRTPRNRKRYH